MKDSQDDPVKEKPDVPPDPVDAQEEAPEVRKKKEKESQDDSPDEDPVDAPEEAPEVNKKKRRRKLFLQKEERKGITR